MTARRDPNGLAPDQIIERIEEALAREGLHTWEDVREALVDGRAQIFWNDHGAWVTEIAETRLKRVLNVWVVAGELPEVMDLQSEVMRYALNMNCSKIVAKARFGWKHVAKAHGWKPEAIIITLPVEGT